MVPYAPAASRRPLKAVLTAALSSSEKPLPPTASARSAAGSAASFEAGARRWTAICAVAGRSRMGFASPTPRSAAAFDAGPPPGFGTTTARTWTAPCAMVSVAFALTTSPRMSKRPSTRWLKSTGACAACACALIASQLALSRPISALDSAPGVASSVTSSFGAGSVGMVRATYGPRASRSSFLVDTRR